MNPIGVKGLIVQVSLPWKCQCVPQCHFLYWDSKSHLQESLRPNVKHHLLSTSLKSFLKILILKASICRFHRCYEKCSLSSVRLVKFSFVFALFDGWGCSRIWHWGQYLGLGRRKWRDDGTKCVMEAPWSYTSTNTLNDDSIQGG